MNSKPKKKNVLVFAKQLTEFRKNRHLTQEELAEKIGMSRSMIAYYEAAAQNPTLETLQKLAKFFNIAVAELLEESENIVHPGPVSKLEKQIARIKNLPRGKQKLVCDMIEAAVSG